MIRNIWGTNVEIMFFRRIIKNRQRIVAEIIVAIHKIGIFGIGNVNTDISRDPLSLICFLDKNNPCILFLIKLYDVSRIICRSIVHKNKLRCDIFLAKQAFYATMQIFLRVENRRNGRNVFFHNSALKSSTSDMPLARTKNSSSCCITTSLAPFALYV